MTQPPAVPPPDPTAEPPARDPTAELPPFSAPHAPPYPSSGTAYPAYQLGSAPVGPPPGYPPVTPIPPYPASTGGRSRGLVIMVVGAVAAVLLCGICGIGGFLLASGNDDGQASAPGTAAPAVVPATPAPTTPAATATTPAGTAHTIVYEVNGGTGPAIITYAIDAGASPNEFSLPWRKEVSVDRKSFLATVFAIRLEGGQLTCRVLVDGQEVASNTSDNAVACTYLVRN